MPSKLGQLIRNTRESKEIGLRELARRIEKSPSFLVGLETGDEPSVSEETLQSIASELELDPDRLIILAGKVPEDAVPEDELDAALFRRVKGWSEEEKRRRLEEFDED